MKNLLLIFSVLLSTSLSAVEYGYITTSDGLISEGASNQVILNNGDILEVLSLYGTTSASSYNMAEVIVNRDGYDFLLFRAPWADDGDKFHNTQIGSAYLETISRKVVGPCSVTLSKYPGFNMIMDYKITRASELEYKNVNIVSLPSSAVGQGTHEIVVEASDDLQSWIPVHSSSIGGDKAFFRTRVVEAE